MDHCLFAGTCRTMPPIWRLDTRFLKEYDIVKAIPSEEILNMQILKHFAFFLCTGSLLACTQHMAVHAAPDTAGGDQTEAETFVRDFYETLSEESLASLPERTDHGTDSRDLHKYMANYKAMFECGFQGYDNIITDVFPLSDEDYQIVLVQYDALFENIDINLPGSTVEVVHKQEDGQWGLFTPYSLSDLHLYHEIAQITESEEVVATASEAARRFDDILQDNPAVLRQLADMSNGMSDLQFKYLQIDFDSFVATYIEEADEKDTPDTYTVQEGDCLWDIAENIFGDGMRWTELYEGNRDAIGGNPDLILTGLLLQL